MSATDARAVKALLSTYWTSAGWRDEPETPPGELEHAVAAGVMFEREVELTHDELVEQVRALGRAVEPADAAAAFLASLTTRRVELRSAIASVVLARGLPGHEHAPDGSQAGWCRVCGAAERETVDRNELSFERHKWGGVRLDDLTYVWHDLDRFTAAGEPPAPTDEDRALFAALLDGLERAAPDVTATEAARTVLRDLKGNKAEREVVLDVLGICSVLGTEDHPGHGQRFVPAQEREVPAQRFADRAYPVSWWTGADGVDRAAATALGLLG